MQRSWLGCIIALAVLVGFSSADDAIYGYIYCGENMEADDSVYARCGDCDPPCTLAGFTSSYAYRVSYGGEESTIEVTHRGDWKVKAYKPEVGISEWSDYYYLGTGNGDHYYHNIYMIPLPKK